MQRYLFYLWILIFICSIYSCRTRNFNYINYYNKALAVDSVFRFHKDTIATIKGYKKLFKKYGKHNQKRLREFETYILLCHLKHKNFGGKNSLYQLIDMITPHKEWYTDYSFFKAYGIDSLEVAARIKKREEQYNKILIDSFTLALKRDQESRRNGYTEETRKADLENINLFKWTLKNYGYPSEAKLGKLNYPHLDLNEVLLLHFHDYKTEYESLEKELLSYVKSGECNPYTYGRMIDRYHREHITQEKTPYYLYPGMKETIIDTIRINKNRKTLGLPSLRHTKLIPRDRKQLLIIK